MNVYANPKARRWRGRRSKRRLIEVVGDATRFHAIVPKGDDYHAYIGERRVARSTLRSWVLLGLVRPLWQNKAQGGFYEVVT